MRRLPTTQVFDLRRGDAVRARLAADRPRSALLHSVASRHLALETVKTVDIPSSLFLECGDGAIVFDVDGRAYIDLIMGFGVHLLGHRPATVESALRAQTTKGWHFGVNNSQQALLAEKIASFGINQEKVLFCGSGSEATYYACRVARAFTGRTRIAVFDGAYHGSHDYALVRADPSGPRDRPRTTTLGQGVPRVIERDTMLVLPYRNTAAFDLIRVHGRDLAAVMVQPVQNNLPRLDMRDFLAGLREACDSVGALLLFDEVVTGMRLGPQGAQGRFGVHPDVTAYGKAIGGGLPIGALAARGEIMELFPRPNDAGGVFSSGTFNANPLTVAAGLAVIEHVRLHAQVLYPSLETAANRLASAVNAFAERHQFPVRLLNAASMMFLAFQEDVPQSARDLRAPPKAVLDDFFLHMLERGVLMPANRMVFLSAAHQASHVDSVAQAICESLTELRTDGLL
jgi:glutamate-1-semialdehyde 2,1-aminomutase